MPVQKCKVFFTPDPTAKFKQVAQTLAKDKIRVNVLVGGQTTLPKLG
jgi:hypothetical protein